jgi:hypothetical protein
MLIMQKIITINKIDLNFRMAKRNYQNEVLHEIAKETLDFLFKNVGTNAIKGILLTGSVANGEGTVIEYNTSLVTSDFDFVIYMDFLHYLKNRNHLQNLSQEISTRLVKKGVNTNVVFLPSTNILQKVFPSTNSGIYEYEFAFASKRVFGNAPSFNCTARPTKRDALELTFTVVGDLILSGPNLSKVEASYVYAKRGLTLLNSILIFHGFFAETYEKRMKIAKLYTSRGIIPITQEEIKILEIFTEYKLSGSLNQLFNSLFCSDMNELIQFQKEFLKNLTIKILYHELDDLFGEREQIKSGFESSIQSKKFARLLKEYSKHSTIKPLSRILGVALFVIWSLANNKRRKDLFAIFVFHKIPPKVLLNILITLLLIYGNNALPRKFLREILPWIKIDANDKYITRMFSLWQTAQQSINLI